EGPPAVLACGSQIPLQSGYIPEVVESYCCSQWVWPLFLNRQYSPEVIAGGGQVPLLRSHTPEALQTKTHLRRVGGLFFPTRQVSSRMLAACTQVPSPVSENGQVVERLRHVKRVGGVTLQDRVRVEPKLVCFLQKPTLIVGLSTSFQGLRRRQ